MPMQHDARDPHPVLIRPFRPEDADFCFRVRTAAFIRQFYDELGAEAVAAAVNAYLPADYVAMARDMPCFVAEVAGDRAGFCLCHRPAESCGETVIPGRNRAFYEKLGYRATGTCPYAFPGKTVEAVHLEKDLTV
jgi:hypothetical protein